MDATRWKLIERIYEEIRELSEADRAAYLYEHPEVDTALIDEINALFTHQEEAASFFKGFQQEIFSSPGDEEELQPAQSGESLVGTRVARYEIEKKIGGGGMGVVYKARDIKLDRDVALKILNHELNADEEARERFVIEAKAASSLAHPNVATIYAIEDILDDRLAISMMYCEGSSLKDRLKKGLPAIDEAVRIAIQVASGLFAAHQKGIVHRDIKPGNIMLGDDGTVRIVDFGLARLPGQSRITKTGSTMGTVAYMAPEQARGGQTTHLVDIWSFGVVLFEMLTGQVPFYGEHIHSMLYAVINEHPIPVAGLRPGIPTQLEQIVIRALTKDPGRRYQDFEMVISDLKTVLEGKDLSRVEAPSPIDDVQSPAVIEPAAEKEAEAVKILIVDDEPDIELLLRQQYLKKIRAGEWKMIFAENGKDALEKLDTDPELQLVLTDIQMPEMDGLTLLSRLGELKRPIRTIVISAYGDLQNIRKAMNRGAYDFLTKPIQFADLEHTIYKTIDHLRTIRLAESTQIRLLKLENELNLARKIQQHILPKQLPQSDEVAVYAYMEPAREVNGDFYDFFYLDDDHLGFFIGDVSGRGLSASIFMAMCRTLLKADAQRGNAPSECMKALNEFLYPDQFDGIFITVFYGILDIRSGELTYCNAGHNPPYVIRQTREIEELPWTGGIGIGVKKNFAYQDARTVLGSQDGLFLYTDGLLKAKNEERKLFSEKQLQAVLQEQAAASPSQLIRRVVREMAEFCMGEKQTDDNTLLAIKRTITL